MAADYPDTLRALEERFESEEACRDYLCGLRWPEGFKCPKCGSHKAWRMNGGLWLCQKCRRQVSVTAGTIFQDSRLSLRTWFSAMWQVTSQKHGVSAVDLQRELGLGSYRTAWTVLHKLRRAMVRPGRDCLTGIVEVDETYWGGGEVNVKGRQTYKKTLIMVAAEVDGEAIGRIRLRTADDLTKTSAKAFVTAMIEPGSTIRTDGLNVYEQIPGYTHERLVRGTNPRAASVLLPRVHRVASLLKRWLLGTHQGAIAHDQLPYYLDEFVFRFNRRTSASRGKLFYRLVQQAAISPVPFKTIQGHNR
jgi:hypothetical protein